MREKTALVVVAHPDDETLWVGGTILANPLWQWTVVSLCRGSDTDRAPKFFRVVDHMGAKGFIGDVDDGSDQAPLAADEVEAALLSLLPQKDWDVIYSHSPFGEYTRHRRHEEVSRAVTALWIRGDLVTQDLHLFAYEDGGREHLPEGIQDAHVLDTLEESIWQDKKNLITNLYGFAPGSWEAETTPRVEAFWRFESAGDYVAWLDARSNQSTGGER
jgi:LmbE family N-acetylglucosaminyl deacetylase